jgi:hypothetical protein
MMWDYDSLWQKARQYIDRAYAQDREDALFAFWASLALEFVARATLAKFSPALLADPTDSSSLLSALGLAQTSKPKSITITTVYLRCMAINVEFTKELADACTTISERRNSELHSGASAFEELKTSSWLAQFYKACLVLLRMQSKELADFLPSDEVAAAIQMIDGLDQSYRDEAKKLIGTAKSSFERLTSEERGIRAAMARIALQGTP